MDVGAYVQSGTMNMCSNQFILVKKKISYLPRLMAWALSDPLSASNEPI
jgi:hypothetical protein